MGWLSLFVFKDPGSGVCSHPMSFVEYRRLEHEEDLKHLPLVKCRRFAHNCVF